jgi:hypothetical protein
MNNLHDVENEKNYSKKRKKGKWAGDISTTSKKKITYPHIPHLYVMKGVTFRCFERIMVQ